MNDGRPASGALVANVQLVLAFVLASAALAAILLALPRGIDLSDEAYYLFNAIMPERFERVTQFGFVYRPVFKLLGHDIAAFRLFGHVVLVGLSWILFRRVLAQAGDAGTEWTRTQFAILLIALASSVIIFYRVWLPTPNYNSLNLSGALLVMAGLVPRLGAPSHATAQSTRSLIADGAMIAVGMALCFLAKPPAAALLTALVLLACIGSWQNVKFACAALVAAALLTAAILLAIDHTPSEIVTRYVNGRAQQLVLRSEHDLPSLISALDPGWLWRNIDLVLTSFAFGCVLVFTAQFAQWPMARPVAMLASLGVVTFAAVWMWTGPAALALPLLAVVCVAWRLLSQEDVAARPADRGLLRMAAVLMAVPFALGFGSNNPINHTSGLYAVFWVAGTPLVIGALLRGEMARNLVAATALAGAIVSASLIAGSIAEPYRLAAPIWRQTEWVAIRDSGLRLDPQAARYLRTLEQAAAEKGFVEGTPMLDLTGRSPGTVYALGAMPPGAPWLIGGHSGSLEFTLLVLAPVPRAELERAWILTAPAGGRLAIDAAQATSRLGLRFPQDYVEVGRATTVGYDSEVHVLWKPVR